MPEDDFLKKLEKRLARVSSERLTMLLDTLPESPARKAVEGELQRRKEVLT